MSGIRRALACAAAVAMLAGCDRLPIEIDGGRDIAPPIAFTGPAPRWITWTADGQHAAFELGGQLVVATGADMKDAVAITGHSTYGHPSWSPDGKELVYDHPRERFRQATLWIRAARPEDVGEDEVVEPPRQLADVPRRDWMPVWSPRGDWIAFHSTRDPASHVWFMRPSGDGARFLAPAVSEEGSLAWSPDGSELAYVSRDGGTPDIWGGSPDTGVTRVIAGGAGSQARPLWRPDGAAVGCLSNAAGEWDVWYREVGGATEMTRITDTGDVVLFNWIADGDAVMFLTRDQKLYAQHVEGDAGPEFLRDGVVFSASPDGSRYIHVQAVENYFRYFADVFPADFLP
ncbi:hypothetical protein HN371_13845 [Candidatus Poribacteria bacterium]|nr:hypothetical protein [Candidatus Poribacteria bacterium]MBT5531825.1 hypothetical protein [Candidatus Poribacteria bacterium]MBT5713098.1 hypothetical protein [Candidatus Poribacteria bacterium]MBT7804654.1 hypothetical protein [Candidatus Poribacteria bacterium]